MDQPGLTLRMRYSKVGYNTHTNTQNASDVVLETSIIDNQCVKKRAGTNRCQTVCLLQPEPLTESDHRSTGMSFPDRLVLSCIYCGISRIVITGLCSVLSLSLFAVSRSRLPLPSLFFSSLQASLAVLCLMLVLIM